VTLLPRSYWQAEELPARKEDLRGQGSRGVTVQTPLSLRERGWG